MFNRTILKKIMKRKKEKYKSNELSKHLIKNSIYYMIEI